MDKENFNSNNNTEPGATKNPYEQMSDEVGEFNQEQALQNIAEAKAAQKTEKSEPSIEVTHEEIVPGVEIILPKTSISDALLDKHKPKIKKGQSERNKRIRNERVFKIELPDVPNIEPYNRAPVFETSLRTGQNKDQAINAAVYNQLKYLDDKVNGIYEVYPTVGEEAAMLLKRDINNLRMRPDHQVNVHIVESLVNEQFRQAKYRAVQELYQNANPIEKMRLKRAGIEDELKALEEFNFDDFKSAEKEASEQAKKEAENIFAPGAANAANAAQDTLDKIGGEVYSPDITQNVEQSPNHISSDDSDASPTRPRLSAEGVSASTISNLSQLAQTHDRDELLDRIYAEDWLKYYDKIVQELFNGDYGPQTQAAIVNHMTREEIAQNLDKMLDNGTFDGYTIIKKMQESGPSITPAEAFIFRRHGYNDIADSHEIKDNN